MKVCIEPGCGWFAQPKSRRCRRHTLPRVRDPFYGSYAWKKLRLQVVLEEPVCQRCYSHLSTDAAHIIARTIRPDLEIVRTNLQGVCHACHSAETRRDNDRRYREQQVH